LAKAGVTASRARTRDCKSTNAFSFISFSLFSLDRVGAADGGRAIVWDMSSVGEKAYEKVSQGLQILRGECRGLASGVQ
jgi:hypothetical protein